MPFVSGQVQQVQVRELPEPDAYENTHKLALKINDAYYDFGGSKGPKFSVKKGKDWVQVEEGDEVEFQYTSREYNGKQYHNAKRSLVTLVAKGSGEAPKAAPARPATNPAKSAPPGAVARSGGSGGTDWARKDAGAAASASIDKAIRYLGITGEFGRFDEEDHPKLILKTARTMNGLTTTLLEEILASGVKAETPKTAEPKAEAPAPAAKAPAKKVAAKKEAAPLPAATWEEEEDEIPF